MTLGELIRLYKAEQEGKQIMVQKIISGYYENRSYDFEIKLSDTELSDLTREEEDVYVTFYIKGERNC